MTKKQSRKVTIIDVARKAGVSPASAGRVLGEYGIASDTIRQKVREAALALGYRPNRLARGLITGRTQTIGVVAGNMESPFYANVLRGISDVAQSRGLGVIIANSDETYQLEKDAVQLLLEKQVDGLLISSSALDDAYHLRAALSLGCYIVQFERIVRGLETDAVVLDNLAAARDCVAKLIEAGHRRIGIIAEFPSTPFLNIEPFLADVCFASANVLDLHPSWQRLVGYLEALRAAGIEPDLQLIRGVRPYSATSVLRETLDILQIGNRPTALFAASGAVSTEVMEAICSMGLALPRELSLVCFDDLDWMRVLKPGITALAQPAYQMGRAATELLLERVSEQSRPFKQVVLAGHLIERRSIAGVSGNACR